VKISIIGTGYVGLVTGAGLADRGHEVTCVDVDPQLVALLNRAQTPIFESGLDELLRKNVGQNLNATTDLTTAVRASEITFIAVGTPFDGTAIDLSAVLNAARQIGAALKDKNEYHVVAVKSTVVPGTTDQKVLPALEATSGKKAGQDFGLGVNPEFLSEGEAVREFMFPDRIVLGGIDARTTEKLEQVYSSFPDAPRIRTNTRTAEMIKYASNALLANLVSFANEQANLGAAIGKIDIVEVMNAVCASQYFRSRGEDDLPMATAFLRAGCGFGGSCLPKDLKALIARGNEVGQSMQLLEATLRINNEQPKRLLALLEKHWPSLNGVRVTVLGLSFKSGTSDVRESPALPLIHELLARKVLVKAYDPVAMNEARKILPSEVKFCDSLESAIEQADALVMVTAWKEFRVLPALLEGRRPQPLLVDGRRMFEKDSVARYEGIGLAADD
jgi:UDPglucose 6-dehydrogenase/GDP-mannose 6-dehydrogenase